MSSKALRTLSEPLLGNNPVTLQVLGICSALAVTTSLINALVMSLALTSVLTLSNASISMIRHHIPHTIRLIVEITIIASLVIVADQMLKAFAFETSKQLSIFVGLIITNCIVLSRAESFALHRPVGASILDGLGNGFGYSFILIVVGTVRELLGHGTLLGYPVLADSGFPQINFMLLPPSAFFLLALIVWGVRTVRPDQVEEDS
jgi:Na+-transporting NADH:ubiquinone oxidoreductase subunit D